jgi:hypothetical protein
MDRVKGSDFVVSPAPILEVGGSASWVPAPGGRRKDASGRAPWSAPGDRHAGHGGAAGCASADGKPRRRHWVITSALAFGKGRSRPRIRFAQAGLSDNPQVDVSPQPRQADVGGTELPLVWEPADLPTHVLPLPTELAGTGWGSSGSDPLGWLGFVPGHPRGLSRGGLASPSSPAWISAPPGTGGRLDRGICLFRAGGSCRSPGPVQGFT